MRKNRLGIPPEVSLYHPIEFLELSKLTTAFLSLGLETFRGGSKNQLICGHLVDFIQKKGLPAIKALPRFRSEYLEEISAKCLEKGLNLLELQNNPLEISADKLQKLSDSISVYQPIDSFDKAANIYSSSNYSLFHFLEFNRKIIWSHVHDIRASILENGILSYPLMILTDCIDGELKYWIVDGQHRFEAFRALGLPIRFTLYQKQTAEPITLYDIVRLVARVNNTARRWSIHQYLRAWTSLQIEEYKQINRVYNRTKIPVNILLQAYSGKTRQRATVLFINGEYQMLDKQNGENYIQYLEELKPLLSRSTVLQSALLDLFRQTPGYNNQTMKNKLSKFKSSWVFPEKHDEALVSLKKLYCEHV